MTPIARSLAVLLLALLPVAAQSPDATVPTPGRARLARVLGLTEAQVDRIRGIRDQHRADLTTRRTVARRTRMALRTAAQDPSLPEAQLRRLHEEAASAQFELLLARRALRQEIQTQLTPEQRGKAGELRKLARMRRGQGIPG